jgi:hypothetical protein
MLDRREGRNGAPLPRAAGTRLRRTAPWRAAAAPAPAHASARSRGDGGDGGDGVVDDGANVAAAVSSSIPSDLRSSLSSELILGRNRGDRDHRVCGHHHEEIMRVVTVTNSTTQ